MAAVRAFEAVARHGTFTAAAVELGTTQAAVSYQIRVLEERLGIALFVRRGRRAMLTAAGARAAERLSLAFDAIDAAFDELRGEDGAVLRISTTSTFASGWLARHLGSFQAEEPWLDIRLSADNRIVDFAAGDVDVAIRSGRGDWAGLSTERLFDLDFTPMCSPSLIAGQDLPLDSRHALALRWINPQDRWWTVWLEANGLSADGAKRSGGIRMDSQIAEAQAALHGQGLAMLSPALWRLELAEGRLVAPFAGKATEGDAYWLAYSSNRRHARKIVRFTRWLTSTFPQLI